MNARLSVGDDQNALVVNDTSSSLQIAEGKFWWCFLAYVPRYPRTSSFQLNQWLAIVPNKAIISNLISSVRIFHFEDAEIITNNTLVINDANSSQEAVVRGKFKDQKISASYAWRTTDDSALYITSCNVKEVHIIIIYQA